METRRNRRLQHAIQLALSVGLASTLSAGTAIAADETAELERVQVTGTRLSRTDLEGGLPVTVIDREQIQFSGLNSVADLLRTTTFNSAGSFRPQSGSAYQSFAGISLRGLGEGRTLILIDGRRAPVAPNVGSAQDLNSIPLSAVERIEILSDGASAVYGSDAIGGVVNIITRKDFTGAEVMIGASNPRREGGDTAEFSAMLGVANDRGNIMFGVSKNHRDIIFAREREWSAEGVSTFSNNFHLAVPNEDSAIGYRPGGAYKHPMFGSVVPGNGCTGPAFEIMENEEDPSESWCNYDFSLVAADEAEVENQSLFARGRYAINSNWSHYFNAGISRVKSFGRYAPVPSNPYPNIAPFLPVGSPNHPATPYNLDPEAGPIGLNPEWERYADLADTPIFFRHRFAALGPRETDIDAHVYDVNLGFEATLGRFDVDFGVRHSESKYLELGRNYVVGDLAQRFIESGAYNIYDPFSVSQDAANSMIATINRSSIHKQQEAYFIANTDLFDMPAGAVQLAFGAEYRDENYVDLYDSLSEGGQVVGSAGNSAGGGLSSDGIHLTGHCR